VRRILEFISDNAVILAGHEAIELRVMAHSVGGAIIGQVAWEYPHISRLLLVNPAMGVRQTKVYAGLKEFTGKTTILVGSKDPAAGLADDKTLTDTVTDLDIITVEEADHNFSGEAFPVFLEVPSTYLFD
jgi:alpha/beta superfamily hydrolase